MAYLAEVNGQAVMFMVNSKGRLIMDVSGYGKEYDCKRLLDSDSTPGQVRAMIEKAQRALGIVL